MHKARQPLFAHWAWGGKLYPPDRYTGLWRGLDVHRRSPVPAIASSTLDREGEGKGNTNMAYSWKDVADTPEAFGMTIAGRESTFDLSFRRVQNFKVSAGEKLRWEGAYLPGRKPPPPGPVGGEVAADANGLITLVGLKLASPQISAGLRITVTRPK
jgi:hypothetical protein